MKKSLILALLPVFMLAGCDKMISFSDEKLDEGFSDGEEHNKTRTIELFDGDKNYISSLSEHTKHEITFIGHSGNEQPVLKTEEEVRNITIDNDNVIESITDISNVNQLHGLKVGNFSDAIDGGITFKFNKTIVGCQILARVRSSTIISGGVINHTIDKKVAINANNSKYISIDCNYLPENYQEIKDTECCFSFANSPTQELSLNVVYQRLEITKITIYE